MSDTSSLSQLARFVGQSSLVSPDPAERRQAINAIAANLMPRQKRSAAELLGVVLALSARTRRVVMPRVDIDLDVFAPDGARAVRVVLPQIT